MQQAFDRAKSAGYMTNWAARLFARVIDERLKALGVASGQMPVFFALADGRPLTQKQLANAASVEQPTMAATLARMERDGLIERRPDPSDGRSSLVSLSGKAQSIAAAVIQAANEVNEIALSGLSATERTVLLENLGKVVAALEPRPSDEA